MAAWCDLAVETAVLNDTDALVGGESNLLEAAVLNDTYSSDNPGVKAVEAAVLNDTTSQHNAALNIVAEGAVLNDTSLTTIYNVAQEVAVLNDTFFGAVAQVVVESAVLNDTTSLSAVKRNSVVETAVLNDASGIHSFELLAETAVLNDTTSQHGTPVSLAVESAVLNDAAASKMFDYLAEVAVLNDTTAQHSAARDIVYDVGYFDDDATGGGAGQVWRTNLDTFPMSRYTNQPWQSMAAIGPYFIMAGEGEGFCVRYGDNDNGTLIASTIEHDLMDKVIGKDGKPAESRKIKRPRFAYLGYTSDGPLLFSLGHVTGSSEQTQGYSFPQARSTQFSNNRVTLGRGIRSRYLRPTIANVAGDNFTLGDGTLIVDEIERSI